MRENNDVGETAEYIGETAEYIAETAEYSNNNTNKWGILNETEFEEFKENIGKAPTVLSGITETTTHLNLRPEWSKNGEDMYPEWNTEESHKNQRENGHQNAPKISGDEMENNVPPGAIQNNRRELTKMTAIYESSQ